MGKIACMFTGQAAQHKNMGKDLYQQYEEARELFEMASEIFGEDLAVTAFEKPFKELTKTHNAQILITLLNVIYYRLAVARGFTPDAVLGLSVGETSALYAAGVLSLEALFKFITIRGKAMHQEAQNHKGSMYAVGGLKDSEIQQIIDEIKEDKILNISNYNSPDQTVIAGDTEAVMKSAEVIQQRGGRAKDLKQEGAWHSLHMSRAREKCAEFLTNGQLNPPKISLLFNVTADFESHPEQIRDNMLQQIVRPVKWKQSLFVLKEQGFDTFYELGPGKILRGLVLSNFRPFSDFDYKVYNLNSSAAIKKLER